ncbi:MAG: MFS transporter [Desulfurococcales archaeon]|nr:MFS transporter [Desulfurococcales archaeon]MEB3788431.1 MFS transporter [Desulfurococcales archaeon]
MNKSRSMKALVAGFPAMAYMYTVGSVGFWLPLYLESRGYSYLNLQLIATFYFTSLALGSLVAGMITDKVKRPDLVAFVGMSVNGLVIIGMYYHYDFKELVILRIVQGLALSTAIPVALGSLSLLFGESLGVGLTSLFMAMGMSFGSLTAGYIISWLGYLPMFIVAGLLSIVAGILSFYIEVPLEASKIKPSILKHLKRLPRIVIIVLLGILMRQTFSTGIYAILAVLFNKILGLTLLATAVALAVNPLVQGLISIPVSRTLQRYARILYPIGILLTSLVFILLYYAESAISVIIAMIVQGIAFGIVNISGNYLIISNVSTEIRYTSSSLFNLFFNLGWIIGTFIAGIYMKTHDPTGWLIIASIGVALTSIIIMKALYAKM